MRACQRNGGAECHRPRDRAAIAKVFAEFPRKKSISLTVRTSWRVWEVESYALSKFQPPTTFGDSQNVEKTILKKNYFLGFWKSVFRHFSWILEELDNFRCQNQLPHAILLQICRFSALSGPQSSGGKGPWCDVSMK